MRWRAMSLSRMLRSVISRLTVQRSFMGGNFADRHRLDLPCLACEVENQLPRGQPGLPKPWRVCGLLHNRKLVLINRCHPGRTAGVLRRQCTLGRQCSDERGRFQARCPKQAHGGCLRLSLTCPQVLVGTG